MYPLLAHCLTHRGKGIKAIVIYPMNALATDQARRFARACHKLTRCTRAAAKRQLLTITRA